MNDSRHYIGEAKSLSEKMVYAHDLLIKFTKIASFVGVLCGFVYLLTFTWDAGIPFPLELNVLPVTLLVVGATSLVGTFIVVAGMFLPALAVEDVNGVTKGYFKAEDAINNIGRAKLQRYFLCTWVPFALTLVGLLLFSEIFSTNGWTKIAAAFLVALAAGWIFFTPRYVETFLENRWSYSFITAFQILLAVFAYFSMLLVFLAVMPEINEWPIWSASMFILSAFSLIHAVISIPITKGRNNGILMPPYFKKETMPSMATALFLSCFFTAMSIFMPQINSKIGRSALRAFHVGGGIPVAICLKTMPAAQIVARFNFSTDFCSGRVLMQFDSGDRVYISSVSPENKAYSGSVYFRQDDIRQKIYFKELKQAAKSVR